ncbi:MAG: efflux RND transporter periplasmic adaptor subunit [Proteobacteria bacterium]|nr:efflux RND transporter periplasmic adaptor subunit [Pseudomonadota bacterium]MBU4009807.1 efflux RND transporter periplasmic adaptor subunit [Pseudomonadota bacterium]MBU4037644.1 efflux RND transporter periplasmic adaptor subunit [Pseudomonadota bacterium]
MKKPIKRIIWILIGIAIIIAAVILVRHRKSELANLAQPSIRPIPVHIKTAISGKLPIIEHYLGTIEPVVEAVLSAQATGYLTSIYKDTGDRVAAGETVAKIDDRLLVSQKSAIAAELAGAREDLEVKKTMLDRRKELIKTKAVSIESLNEAYLAYELAYSRLQRLKQEIEASNVSLSFTGIRSLFNGVITKRLKNHGDMVTTGTPVFKIEDTKRGYKVIVHVSQETVTRLSKNMPFHLSNGAVSIDATEYRIHPAITTGNLATVEIRVPDRPFGLPSYGTVGVDMIVGMPEGLVVSSDCILEQETGALVFVVQDNESVRPVPVKILGYNGEQAVIEGSLSPGTPLAAGAESMLMQLSRHGRIMIISEGEK